MKVSSLFASPLNKLVPKLDDLQGPYQLKPFYDLGNTVAFYFPVKSHSAREEWRSAE